MRTKTASGSHVSRASATLPRKSTIWSTPALIGLGGEDLKHELEARVGPVRPADLGRGQSVGEDDVGGEVVLAANERRADAVRVDGHLAMLEGTDLLRVEAARGDDLDPFEAVFVQSLANLPDEPLIHAGRPEVAHLVPERAVDERLGRIEANAPEALAEGAG